MSTAAAKQPVEPTQPTRRIEAVDVVRGFALFGVLLVNMYNFGASSPAWSAPYDEFAFSVKRFLFETKSWRLFSFLFGLGFALQMLRAEQSQAGFPAFYLRRLIVLFAIGTVHTLLYAGDILNYYAELGLILLLFRRVPPKALLAVATILIMVWPVERAVKLVRDGPREVAPREVRLQAARERLRENQQQHPYSVGSMGDVMVRNARIIPLVAYTDNEGPESAFPYFAMFLLGLYVGRKGIVQNLEAHQPFIRRIGGWGIAIGVFGMTAERVLHSTVGYEVYSDAHEATVLQQLAGDTVFAVGSTALCVGYAAVLALLAQEVRWKPFLSPLGAVGRMALTTYLVQTLMFTTLFYGYAFGQAFRIGPAAVTAYAVLFFAVQLAVCSWWMRHSRFGPVEWLWRTLSYLQLQPWRIAR
jgi:uncharacterized protein